MIMDRNFNTISPSAKSLLLLKGFTNIPFAREAAGLLTYPEPYRPDFEIKDIKFWAKITHFESRYWSIDQLLSGIPVKNILELSSGFSFRGLEMIKRNGFHYIDTDLPEVIALKKNFINGLWNDDCNTGSILETLPLNALNEEEFNEIVSRFPKGEIVIVNEGLLMYLDNSEKEKLCKIIHNILKVRGGFWITADIYTKNIREDLNIAADEKQKQFFKHHNIEGNKFDSFEAAGLFFNNQGFAIDKEAHSDPAKLSSLKYLLRNTEKEELIKIRSRNKIRLTWRLSVLNK